MEPGMFAKARVPASLEAKMIVPPGGGTCISPSCIRTLDYFLMDKDLAKGHMGGSIEIE